MIASRALAAITLAAAGLLVTSCSVGAGPQSGGTEADYPNASIEAVVPYDAGGATDQLARTVISGMEPELNGQSVVVLNESGGAGTSGMTSVVNSEPNGYKLAFIAGGPLTVQPHYGKTSYSYDDVTPIARIATSPIVLAVRADAPWNTIQELVADLKKNPGSFRYASTGVGNPASIAMEKFDSAAGVDTKQVPFKSSSETVTALLGKNVDGAAGLPQGFTASVKSGDLKILANLGSVKDPSYEKVPTLKESGIDASTDLTSGIVGPKGLSNEVVTALADAVQASLKDTKVLERISSSGAVPDFGTGEEYAADIKSDFDENGIVLKELGLIP
ncbi:hypothetical protein ASF98_11725 [Arthrobacter sp. Leaf337]|uniref:Bug family tripartite tricarboxylate transporter substrate binding protein n=1 Tax=Arthrobacter sp. Leaf337 TaxID=1736342 RepID=UPI0006F5B419|nr:tripartite tricarboxylate transporter substrate binding protein [Arthrobacter sp. Leaf337]KQR64157.1 hypothetical protein ASF98_11725 [Arthrobacter sp. Leaf337]